MIDKEKNVMNGGEERKQMNEREVELERHRRSKLSSVGKRYGELCWS